MICSRGDNRYLFDFLMVAGICKIYTTFMTKALATSNISCILHYYFVDFIEKHTTLAQDVDLLLEWFSDTNNCSVMKMFQQSAHSPKCDS